MSIITERRLINLNSEDSIQKLNGTFLSDVIFNFSNVLKEEKTILFCEGGVYNAQIPVSFYGLNYTNVKLNYQFNSINYSITLNVGNYTFTTLSTEMSNKFLLNGHTISLTINKTSGIITFTASGGTLNKFIESGSTIWRILGFSDKSGDVNAILNIITPPYLLNLLGIKKLKIYSEALGIYSLDSKNYSTSTLIDTINVNVPAYGLILHENQQAIYSRLKKKTINQIDIQIKDEYSNFINMNNTDWSITLALIIYRRVDLEENNDLNKIIETLGNITNILENTVLTPQTPNNAEIQEEQPITTDLGQQPLEVDDLDLLLYENPNF
jgi:hypothetical protein